MSTHGLSKILHSPLGPTELMDIASVMYVKYMSIYYTVINQVQTGL
jgi:hypothetical protein